MVTKARGAPLRPITSVDDRTRGSNYQALHCVTYQGLPIRSVGDVIDRDRLTAPRAVQSNRDAFQPKVWHIWGFYPEGMRPCASSIASSWVRGFATQ
jgi:hypothetical protein